MNNLTVTFNDKSTADIKAATEAFGFKSDDSTVALATVLLRLAAQAKKEGKDLAIVQDIRSKDSLTIQVDGFIDLRETSELSAGRVNVPSRHFTVKP